MKIGKVTSNDSIERLSVSVRNSTVSMIEAYREFYQATYGDEIKQSQLVEEMLRNFMSTDKEFQKFIEQRKKPAKPTTTSQSAAPASNFAA